MDKHLFANKKFSIFKVHRRESQSNFFRYSVAANRQKFCRTRRLIPLFAKFVETNLPLQAFFVDLDFLAYIALTFLAFQTDNLQNIV